MLRFAEEILLIALDDCSGRFHPLPDRALDFALAGAILIDLAEKGCLTLGERRVRELSSEPPGDRVLGFAMEQLSKIEGDEVTIERALSSLAAHGGWLRDQTLGSLVEREILSKSEDRFLWVFHSERYPLADRDEERIVKRRLRHVILDGDEPSPRDAALLAIVDVCQLGFAIFTREELDLHAERLRTISRSQSVGRAMIDAIGEVQNAILQIRAYAGM